MGKSTIFMAIFNSYVKLPEGKQTNNEIGDCKETSTLLWASYNPGIIL